MEKDYSNTPENAAKDEQHQSNKFRVRKKQMYIKLLNQMEFYFSNSNIAKDRFMSKMLLEDPFVPLSSFLNFNKIAQILRSYAITEEKQQQESLAKSISKSSLLELSEDSTKIRLKVDLPKKTQDEIDECTIYVEQIPLNSSHDSLKLIFSKYGKINYISLPRYKKSRQIKQFCFIEFDDSTSVQNALIGFKKIDGVLQYTAVKPEHLLSITTFEKDDTHEPPSKKAKIETEENKEQPIATETLKESKDEEIVTKSEEDLKPASEKEVSEQEANETDDAPKKKKRKHKRRNTAKNKYLDEHVMAMKVMKKNEWKKLRNAYLNLERQKAKEIKKILRESYNKRNDIKNQAALQTPKASPKISFYGSPNDRNAENATEPVTESIFESYQSGNLNYTPGCIVNIKFREPCVDFKEFKKELKQFPSVQYVDIMEGGSQCFIRVNTSQSAHELVSHYSSCEYEIEILKNELEKDYWKKIFDNREKKKKNEDKTKPTAEKKHRRRGREKLMDKISKVTQNQIIRFSELDAE